MIGATELAQMKASAVLINTCRGSVVDEKALCAALANGQIAGAGLGRFRGGTLPNRQPLLTLPNVLLTPHAAGVTRDTWARRGTFVFDNIRRVLRGPPAAQIQPDGTDAPVHGWRKTCLSLAIPIRKRCCIRSSRCERHRRFTRNIQTCFAL